MIGWINSALVIGIAVMIFWACIRESVRKARDQRDYSHFIGDVLWWSFCAYYLN